SSTPRASSWSITPFSIKRSISAVTIAPPAIPIPTALAAVAASFMAVPAGTSPPAPLFAPSGRGVGRGGVSVGLVELDKESAQSFEQAVPAPVALERPGAHRGDDPVEERIRDGHRGHHGILHPGSGGRRHQYGIGDLADCRNRRVGYRDDR